MQLCQNRPEGFGPHSDLHSHLPTTCFLDVIVEPLATWIYLVILLVLLPLRIVTSRRRRASHNRHAFKPDEEGHDTNAATSRGCFPTGVLARVLEVIYYLLTIAMIAMVSLEIARLSVAQLGIGLLPFTYVGVLAAIAGRVTWRAKLARFVGAFYWLMLVAVFALKTATEQEEQMDPTVRRVMGQGTQGNYPSSDEVVDNAVMLGVALVLGILEFVGFGKLRWM